MLKPRALPIVSHHEVNRLARAMLWMRLDSRLRGHDAVWCGEEVFVAHEPLCCDVTGYRCATANNTKRATRLGHNARRVL